MVMMTKHIPDDDIDEDKPLSAREAAFVDAYIETRSMALSAKAVGVSQNAVYLYRKRAHVAKQIAVREKENANRADISNEWLITQIKDTALLAKSDKSWAAAIKGFETLAKINGMFEESKNSGISYNMMGNVIIAPDAEAAKKLLENPDVVDGDYEVLDFNIGEDNG